MEQSVFVLTANPKPKLTPLELNALPVKTPALCPEGPEEPKHQVSTCSQISPIDLRAPAAITSNRKQMLVALVSYSPTSGARRWRRRVRLWRLLSSAGDRVSEPRTLNLKICCWERERERERECVCVCVFERKKERVSMCARERERESVCVRERVCVCVCV